MEFTAQQIATLLNGIVDGDPNTIVNNISKIDESTENSITFLANPLYAKFIYTTKSSVIIVSNDFIADKPILPTLIRVSDPYQAFTTLLQQVNSFLQKTRNGISKNAVIQEDTWFEDKSSNWIADYVVFGEKVKVFKDVKIYPNTYIGDNVIIGEGTIIHPGVKIYEKTQIGKNCIIHAGTVLGADGFGFAPNKDGTYTKIPQIGNVIIHDDVEIGANTTIDRATMGSTIIKKGTKLDNLIMVAHNCEIGNNTVVASQSGFSGSSKVGNNCMIGGQVGIAGHIKIGNKVVIAAQSGIGGNIQDNSTVMGSPAIDASKYKRAFILFKNFEKLNNRISQLENKLKEINK